MFPGPLARENRLLLGIIIIIIIVLVCAYWHFLVVGFFISKSGMDEVQRFTTVLGPEFPHQSAFSSHL